MTTAGRRNLTLTPANVQDGQLTSSNDFSDGLAGASSGGLTPEKPPATRINEHLESILGSINSAMTERSAFKKDTVTANTSLPDAQRHVFDASDEFKAGSLAAETSGDDLFHAEPMKFDDPFAQQRELHDINHPNNLTENQFQEEMVNRMAQLEQVVGHNFSDLTSVATDAAQEATRMTLKELDETAFAHRLNQIEGAFKEHMQRQAEKDAQTTIALQQLNELASVMRAPRGPGGRPVASESNLPLAKGPAPDAPNGVPGAGALMGANALGKSSGETPVNPIGQMTASPGGDDKLAPQTNGLRAQLDMPSKDEDLDDGLLMKRTGARPAVIVVTIALLLASLGLILRDNPMLIDNFIGRFADNGESAAPQDLAKKGDALSRVSGLEPEQRIDLQDVQLRGKRNVQSDDGIVSGNISRRLSNDELAKGQNAKKDSLSKTSSKGLALGKQQPKLIPLERDLNPEMLLPTDSGKLPVPTALVGPFSLRHAAANGNPSAQYEVGRRFAMGIGIKRNYDEAVKWYMRSASHGFAPAQYRLATLYERGLGVKKDLQRSMLWYKRAAELGNVKAMHNLAVIYASQNKDQPDYLNAIYWFKEAARRNLSDSQFNLATLYQSGVGLKKNLVEAYKWFSLAARVGDVEAARRRDFVEKQLSRQELVLANSSLQGWKPQKLNVAANEVKEGAGYITSTLSHARETVKRSQILTAQILLRKLGYKLDDVNGELTQDTAAAIRLFEKNKGLPATGKVSKDLLKVLNQAAI